MSGAPTVPATTQQRRKASITLIGLAVNLPLGLGKILVGSLAGSQALVADGVHSLSDLLGDLAVLYAVRQAGRGPDSNHPYGHGRFETLATVSVAVLLLVTAGGLAWSAIAGLVTGRAADAPETVALAAVILSLLIKEALYQATIRVARSTRSSMLAANAWHHRSDALSSLVALIGIGGAMAGLPELDAVAALVIAVMLAHVAIRHGWPALSELADTEMEPELRAAIQRELADFPGVEGVRALRTRRVGGAVLADVSVAVAPGLTVSEGHRIVEAATERVLGRLDPLMDLVIHLEPAGHLEGFGATEAPLRAEVLAGLREAWSDPPPALVIEDVRLDYLDHGLRAEVVVSGADGFRPAALRAVEADLGARARQVLPRLAGFRLLIRP